MAGRAEHFVPKMMENLTKEYGMWLKKNTDMTQFLKSKEPGVDYNLALASVQIEVKNTDKDGTLSDKPSEIQTKLLNEYDGYIFLMMWDPDYPRLPAGGDAYLVPWKNYQKFMEQTDVKGKSVRRHATARAFGADEILKDFSLKWTKGTWTIPPDNPFWKTLEERSNKLSQFIKELPNA